MQSRTRLLGVTALALGASSQAQAICYVNSTLIGGADSGTSWSNAYTDLQTALQDTHCNEIWVAKGVYKPTSKAKADQTVSFDIKPGVAVYGGFIGDGTEFTRNASNPAKNRTVLSGDIDDNDANVGGSEIDTTAEDIVGANSFHVVTMDGTTAAGNIVSNTVLDGFTITAGEAAQNLGTNYPEYVGAGLYCDGEGMGNECSPSLTRLIFSGNAAREGFGGALYNNALHGKSDPIISDSRFEGNLAIGGGAMANEAEATDSECNPTISRTVFAGNTAAPNLGYAAFGGAIANAGKSNAGLQDVVFSYNLAESGGAIANLSNYGTSSPTITGATFMFNAASDNGGALYNVSQDAQSDPVLLNSTFVGNTSTNFGGAIFNSASMAGASSPLLASVTFSANSAARGGAMYNDATSPARSSPVLRNVILWGDTALASDPEIFNDNASPDIDYSIVEGGCPFESICGGGLITKDPMLGALADHGGFEPTLLPAIGSPAIDSGDNTAGTCPTIDQRGFPRSDGGCDIGSVERQTPEDIIFKDGFGTFTN